MNKILLLEHQLYFRSYRTILDWVKVKESLYYRNREACAWMIIETKRQHLPFHYLDTDESLASLTTFKQAKDDLNRQLFIKPQVYL
jgi:hypothetical protein